MDIGRESTPYVIEPLVEPVPGADPQPAPDPDVSPLREREPEKVPA